MSDKPYHLMDDHQLKSQLSHWERLVADAPGWSSCYFAAKQVEVIVRIGNSRGLGMTNNYPIKHGW